MADEPDLNGAQPDEFSIGGMFKSIMGFMKDNQTLSTTVGTGLIAKMLGNNWTGTAEGAAETALLEKEGAPWWVAGLGGLATAAIGSGGGFKGLLAGAVIAVGMHYLMKEFGHGGPAPSSTPAPSN